MASSIPWIQSFNTAFSPFNPAAAFGASSPLSFAPAAFDATSAVSGLGAAAGAAALLPPLEQVPLELLLSLELLLDHLA